MFDKIIEIWGPDRINRRAFIAVVITPFLFIWAIVLIVIGDWDANADLFNQWLHPNRIELSASEGIETDGFSIQWKTDLMSGPIELYKNGEQIYENFREQEDNYFTVLYRNQPIAVFDQIKKKGVYGHHYHFFVSKPADRLQVNLSIEGRDTTFILLQ
ncbi:MAG: hypothetical protein K0R51_1566 [Cytophagaceae bacterium]|jgi:hypothetical protein|nr:hypothetical protein [Cytophagaceae bacterium]